MPVFVKCLGYTYSDSWGESHAMQAVRPDTAKTLNACCSSAEGAGDLVGEDDEPPEPIATPRQEAPAPALFPEASQAAAPAAAEPPAPALQPSEQNLMNPSSVPAGPALTLSSGGLESEQLSGRHPTGQGPAASQSNPAEQQLEQNRGAGAHVSAPMASPVSAHTQNPFSITAGQMVHSRGTSEAASERPPLSGPLQPSSESTRPAAGGTQLDSQRIFDAARQTILQKMEEVRYTVALPCS